MTSDEALKAAEMAYKDQDGSYPDMLALSEAIIAYKAAEEAGGLQREIPTIDASELKSIIHKHLVATYGHASAWQWASVANGLGNILAPFLRQPAIPSNNEERPARKPFAFDAYVIDKQEEQDRALIRSGFKITQGKPCAVEGYPPEGVFGTGDDEKA